MPKYLIEIESEILENQYGEYEGEIFVAITGIKDLSNTELKALRKGIEYEMARRTGN